MPVASYRMLYKISNITSNVDDNPTGTDPSPGTGTGQTTKPLYVLMKKSHGDYLGLTALDWNAPELTGTFGGSGNNAGTKYRKRIGGFRVASYTLLATTQFDITEYIKKDDGSYGTATKKFRSISIGLPRGHSVNEFITFLVAAGKTANIRGIRTPSGRTIPVYAST